VVYTLLKRVRNRSKEYNGKRRCDVGGSTRIEGRRKTRKLRQRERKKESEKKGA